MNFGRSEKVKKTICRSLGRIDKMDFFLGKVKKWKKRSVEVLGVLLFVGRNDELTKWIFLGKSEKVQKTICRMKGVLLFVGRNDKKDFFWEK